MEKYILLSTFATLTQEELELTKDWEETPLAVVGYCAGVHRALGVVLRL